MMAGQADRGLPTRDNGAMKEWTNVDDWLEQLEAQRGADEAAVASRIAEWSTDHNLKHRGDGNPQHSQGIVYTPVIPAIDWDPAPFAVSSKLGRVALSGANIGAQGRRPYGNESSFSRLLERLKAIPGVAPHKGTYPDITLADLADDATFTLYFDLMDEVVRQIRRANL